MGRSLMENFPAEEAHRPAAAGRLWLRPDRPARVKEGPASTEAGPRGKMTGLRTVARQDSKAVGWGVLGAGAGTGVGFCFGAVPWSGRFPSRGVGSELVLNCAIPVASAGCIVQTRDGFGFTGLTLT